jgi:DNA-binding response OmpR family regulator
MAKPKAMVLDDDESFSWFFNLFLERQGLDVEGFKEIPTFLDHARKENPDIYFVDLNIREPGDGFSAIQTLRESGQVKQPIVIVSSSSNSNTLLRALNLGATDFLVKPISREVLLGKMHRLLGMGLREEELPVLPAKCLGAQLDIGVELNIVEMDETGLTLVGDHFLPNGRIISVTSDLFKEITRSEESQLLTLTRVETTSVAGKFRYYALFDPGNLSLNDAVRRWLLTQQAKEVSGV